MDETRVRVIASWAEVLSALAIVVSLVYAVNEFRRTDALTAREAEVKLFERVADANRQLVEVPGLAEAVVAARSERAALSEAEQLRYLAYQHAFFDTWEIGWSYHQDGILGDDAWSEWSRWFEAEAARRPSWAWTENRRHFTGEAFRRVVDRVMEPRETVDRRPSTPAAAR